MKKSAICQGFKGYAFPNDDYISNTDVTLEKATIAVQNEEPVSTTFESLYNRVADLIQPKHAKQLSEKLETLIDAHSRSLLDQFKQDDLKMIPFLKKMNDCWKKNCQQLTMIKGIFLYLDRKFILPDKSMIAIWDLGIERFRHYFSTNFAIHKRTTDDIIALIESERQGGLIDRVLVKDLLSMLSTLSLYKSTFEPRFFDETQNHYRSESQRLFNEQDVPEYLHYVDRVIGEEMERSTQYLDSLTQKPLIETVEKELIVAHLNMILSKGLEQLLDDMRIDDLILLHSLMSRAPTGLQELCLYFNKYIKQRGLVIVTNIEGDKNMVQDLLNFKSRMDKVVNECFQRQEKFIYSLKEAFESFINQRQNKPAELIAKYIDSKLRSGNKEATEDELEKTLDDILVLFRFVHGKDVFEAFYKKDLAKRLLVNKSASVDAEKSMLSKLRQECGSAFTSKLEGMFKDIEVSKDLMLQFKNHLHNQRKEGSIDLTVNVLTMGYWPTYQPMKVELPDFMMTYQKAFEKFYTSRKHGRKLQWQPNLSLCTLIANFEQSKNELIVSLFQALVLLLFNAKDEIKYKELEQSTAIDPLELKRTLQSLACGKKRVLIKEPRGKDIDDDDKFIYNANFKDQLYKIKINQVQLKETQEEQSMTEERVFQDRQYQIDAAIVRIMKTRKKLNHNALVTEVFDHLKFPVRAQDIKVRIDSLIERDYVHRDEENKNSYNYVA